MDLINYKHVNFLQHVFVQEHVLPIADDYLSIRIVSVFLLQPGSESCQLFSSEAIVKQVFVELLDKLLVRY